MTSSDQDDVVSMIDVLQEGNELEEEAAAVLGDSDDKCCTYLSGYVKRQALYACRTCQGSDGPPAGICLACSYECHDGHEFVELYTKRNFRCDCGNSKFPNLSCKLIKIKQPENVDNHYNHNFHGTYCICKRPYPDPEDEVEDEMIQCVVCEDWFHGRHLGLASVPDSVECQEMVCEACMEKCHFLWKYRVHSSETKVVKMESTAEVDVTAHEEHQTWPNAAEEKPTPKGDGLSEQSGAAMPSTSHAEAASQSTVAEAASGVVTCDVSCSGPEPTAEATISSSSSTGVHQGKFCVGANKGNVGPSSLSTPRVAANQEANDSVSSSTGATTDTTIGVATDARGLRDSDDVACPGSVGRIPATTLASTCESVSEGEVPTTSIASTSQNNHSPTAGVESTSASPQTGSKQPVDKSESIGAETGLECKLRDLGRRQIVRSKGAVFWPLGWRAKLCVCQDCKAMYERLQVSFLQDTGDSVVTYEERGMVKRKGSQYDQGMEALSSMNRIQQVEMLHGYQDMKTALSEFLKGFAEQGKVVTAEDIQEFYQGLARKKQRVGSAGTVQYLCR